jgi:hypothetical protein
MGDFPPALVFYVAARGDEPLARILASSLVLGTALLLGQREIIIRCEAMVVTEGI